MTQVTQHSNSPCVTFCVTSRITPQQGDTFGREGRAAVSGTLFASRKNHASAALRIITAMQYRGSPRAAFSLEMGEGMGAPFEGPASRTLAGAYFRKPGVTREGPKAGYLLQTAGGRDKLFT
jgi:hypothetical protein